MSIVLFVAAVMFLIAAIASFIDEKNCNADSKWKGSHGVIGTCCLIIGATFVALGIYAI